MGRPRDEGWEQRLSSHLSRLKAPDNQWQEDDDILDDLTGELVSAHVYTSGRPGVAFEIGGGRAFTCSRVYSR